MRKADAEANRNHIAGRRARSRAGAPLAGDEVYRLQAEMCRALGHPDRLRLIDALKGGERSTAELLREIKLGRVNLSRHLKALRTVGLVEARFSGREARYRLAFRDIGSACAGIRQVLALRLDRNAKLATSLLASSRP